MNLNLFNGSISSQNEIVFLIDPEFNLLFLNEAWEGTMGFDLKESLGKPFVKFLLPHDRDTFYGLLEAMDSQNSKSAKTSLNFLTKTAAIVKSQVFVTKSYNKDQEFTGYSGYLKQNGNDPKSNSIPEINDENLKYFFNMGLVGMALLNGALEWIMVNDKLCDLLDFSRENLIGQSLTDFSPKNELDLVLPVYHKILNGQLEEMVLEKHFVRSSGEVVFLEVELKGIKNPENEVEFIIAQFRDVSYQKFASKKINELNEKLEHRVVERTKKLEDTFDQLKTAQSKLVQSEKLASLGVLTAGIAHELNNPINYINAGIVGLRILIEHIVKVVEEVEKINPENFREQLEILEKLKNKIAFYKRVELSKKVLEDIGSGAVKATEIVKGLQAFSRAGDEVAKNVNLHVGLDATLLLLQNQLKNRIEVTRDYGAIPSITCFPGKLNQAFMNILLNSIQSIKDKGAIIISTNSDQNWIYIKITDSGVGMSAKVRERIFEPFYTTREVGKGTGLGLSITLGIVKAHKGKIEIESKKGKGTHVKISLPLSFTGGSS